MYSKVDAAIANDTTAEKAAKKVTASVAAYDQGVKVGVVSGASFTLNDKTDKIDASYDNKVFVKTFEVTANTNLQSVLKVVYDGNEVKAEDDEITSAVKTLSTTTNIDKVTVKIKLATNVCVEKELPIGKTIVVK